MQHFTQAWKEFVFLFGPLLPLFTPGRVGQSVTCLTADPGLIIKFDPGPVPYFHGDLT